MKKTILVVTMLIAMQAQAITVVPHVSVITHVTPHVAHITPVVSHSTSIHARTSSAIKMTNSAKTITSYPLKQTEVVKTHSMVKPVVIPVGSLNTPSKAFGCQEPKVEKKAEVAKCDK